LGSVTLAIEDRDSAIATDAAAWSERFYPGMSVIVANRTVQLEAPDLTAERLKRIWYASLANERSYFDNGARRRTLLEGLTQ
jgi:hypothetical protein